MRIVILKDKGNTRVREIEDESKTWVQNAVPANSDEVGNRNLTDFFESCDPPHTGSVESGSYNILYDDDGNITGKFFKGEDYLIGT